MGICLRDGHLLQSNFTLDDKEEVDMRAWLMLGAASAVLSGCGDPLTPEEKEARACSPTMAYVMAKNNVELRLKAPSTAEFGSYGDSRVVQLEGGCKFLVVGYVDAQNGFGAMLRNTYTATMEKTPGEDIWTARDVIVN